MKALTAGYPALVVAEVEQALAGLPPLRPRADT